MTILLLAGTAEARRLAAGLADRGIDVLASLAGAVRRPKPLAVRTRVGGFGGAAGFERTLKDEGISAVIDATHPFAASITRRTWDLCTARGLPHLRLERPGWPREPDWRLAPDIDEAAALIPADGIAFLATGRQSLAGWTRSFTGCRAHLRVVDPPDEAFPLPGDWVVGLPSVDADDERATFAALGVTHLVAKDSGGDEGGAKFEAARALGLTVIVIRRPARPEGMKVAETVEDALDWATQLPLCSRP